MNRKSRYEVSQQPWAYWTEKDFRRYFEEEGYVVETTTVGESTFFLEQVDMTITSSDGISTSVRMSLDEDKFYRVQWGGNLIRTSVWTTAFSRQVCVLIDKELEEGRPGETY